MIHTALYKYEIKFKTMRWIPKEFLAKYKKVQFEMKLCAGADAWYELLKTFVRRICDPWSALALIAYKSLVNTKDAN